jgi:hypothetical protein
MRVNLKPECLIFLQKLINSHPANTPLPSWALNPEFKYWLEVLRRNDLVYTQPAGKSNQISYCLFEKSYYRDLKVPTATRMSTKKRVAPYTVSHFYDDVWNRL